MSKRIKRQMFFAQSEQGFEFIPTTKKDEKPPTTPAPNLETESNDPDGPLPWEQQNK